MGCDIHMFTEVKDTYCWRTVSKPVRSKWGYMEDYYAFGGRNYDLFAMLANVRNGRGFAGVSTGAGFQPIALPKGLPPDVSEIVEAESERWGSDGHSHSWLTLRELLDFPAKDLHTTKSGWMSASTYFAWQDEKAKDPKAWPKEWSGGISGPNIRHVKAAEVTPADRSDRNVYVYAEWPVSYYEAAKHFFDDNVPHLQELANELGLKDDEVRYVFWFDN